MTMGLRERLDQAVAAIRARAGATVPAVGLVLGSGLGAFAARVENATAIAYGDIPGFAASGVVGHAGRLVLGAVAHLPVAVMQGRVHFYEGHDLATTTFPIRTLVHLGARTLILTNAAGGIGAHLRAGSFMLIRDHLNLFPDHPLRGPNDDRVGPRFPDMTAAYAPELLALAHRAASALGVDLAEGVYAGLPGPAYETPAEIEMLRRLGADAVGMSTVPEVIVARHMGARVLGLSCITNAAAGHAAKPLSHDEVTETAGRVESTFAALLEQVLRELARESAREPGGKP
jgi:purine-nucleoside phosphorylase